MGLFDRRKSKRTDLGLLEVFATTHEGVEAYLEPKTPTMPLSLLLVARDGEWTRSPVHARQQAESLCKRLSIPFYDAAIVGYPDRMRGMKGKPAPKAPSVEELEAWFSKGTEEDAGT